MKCDENGERVSCNNNIHVCNFFFFFEKIISLYNFLRDLTGFSKRKEPENEQFAGVKKLG